MLFPFQQTQSIPQRVVITGAGIITGLGQGWEPNERGFRTGQRAFRPVSLFDVSRQRAKEAAEVSLPAALPQLRLSLRQVQRLDRAAILLLLATDEALRQAGWKRFQGLRVVLGTTSGGMGQGETYFRRTTSSPPLQRGQPTRIIHYQAQTQGRLLGKAFGFEAPVRTIGNACAAGANAIGQAWELIRWGRAPIALAGGYDALSQMVFAGFDSLQALSTTVCRPFDSNRDGLALGEGAALLAMESLEHARSRGAVILGEVAGYGAATDIHHLTQPHPEGVAAFSAMQTACEIANLQPRQIDYLNAHGTGTQLNDSAEMAAIHQWAGQEASRVVVSSTKASIGHLLGAAGAVEAVVCLMALRGQWVPPTSTLRKPDPGCRFQLPTVPGEMSIHFAMSNSFGFGGANASLIFKATE